MFLETRDVGLINGVAVVDPAKVTRTALQNAASIAGLMLTTEAMIADFPEEKAEGGMPGGGMAAWAMGM